MTSFVYFFQVSVGHADAIAQALGAFEEAIIRFPNCPECYLLFAQVLSDQQNFKRADEYFSRALKVLNLLHSIIRFLKCVKITFNFIPGGSRERDSLCSPWTASTAVGGERRIGNETDWRGHQVGFEMRIRLRNARNDRGSARQSGEGHWAVWPGYSTGKDRSGDCPLVFA